MKFGCVVSRGRMNVDMQILSPRMRLWICMHKHWRRVFPNLLLPCNDYWNSSVKTMAFMLRKIFVVGNLKWPNENWLPRYSHYSKRCFSAEMDLLLSKAYMARCRFASVTIMLILEWKTFHWVLILTNPTYPTILPGSRGCCIETETQKISWFKELIPPLLSWLQGQEQLTTEPPCAENWFTPSLELPITSGGCRSPARRNRDQFQWKWSLWKMDLMAFCTKEVLPPPDTALLRLHHPNL